MDHELPSMINASLTFTNAGLTKDAWPCPNQAVEEVAAPEEAAAVAPDKFASSRRRAIGNAACSTAGPR